MFDATDDLASGPARVTIEGDGDDVVVRVVGDVDAATAGVLAAVLAAAMTAGVARLIVDASQITFLDAAGVRALSGETGSGRRTVVRRPSRPVRRVLEVAGWADLIEAPPRSAAAV
jgi:anti-anti-sigma factor